MDASPAKLRHVSEPLVSQRIEGTIRLRFWAQAIDPAQPATWTVAIRLLSRDGTEERGDLLPLTTGSDGDTFGPNLAPRIVGPFPLVPLEASDGDRILLELGSRGPANIMLENDKATWVQFSGDLLFEELRMEPRQSRKVGRCIYCGRNDAPLSREHIIPEGLNGEWTLIKAACGSCSDITSLFEADLLREALRPARTALRMRTKRPRERPTCLPIRVRDAGIEAKVDVPVEDYPGLIAFPVFEPPGYLCVGPGSSSIKLVNVALAQVSGPPLTVLHRKHGCEYTEVQLEYQPVEFARAIAKIAYGFAVLGLGLERIADCYVLPVVMGQARDIGRWVGCDPGQPVGQSTELHTATLRILGKEIHVLVRLFARFHMPEYHVVVGRSR